MGFMKKGTKAGLLLMAASIILAVWVIAGQSSQADTTDGFDISDDGRLVNYSGAGGTVTIPDGVTTIGASAFSNNTNVTQVVMPNSVTTMESGAFQGCSNLSSISLSSNLGAIPANGFRECTSLSGIEIPGSVKSIGSNAFYGCASLTSVTIPASVTNLSTDAFDSCRNLTNISVAAGNNMYLSQDGCVYNGAGKILLIVPQGKTSLNIPSGTVQIAAGALQGSTALSSVTIPASVTSIGSQGSWKPQTIYGAANSAAETYAMDNDIAFIVNGASVADTGDDENSGGDEGIAPQGDGNTAGDYIGGDDGSGDVAGDGSGDNSGSGSTAGLSANNNGSTAGSGNGSGSAAGTAAATGAAGGSTAAGTSGGTSAAAATHTLDDTPTTADGVDPRYFLCMAIFAAGVGAMTLSRSNKMRYVSDRKTR
jgi:hypothetical protein